MLPIENRLEVFVKHSDTTRDFISGLYFPVNTSCLSVPKQYTTCSQSDVRNILNNYNSKRELLIQNNTKSMDVNSHKTE